MRICGINIASYHNKSFIAISSDIIMRYTVVDLYSATGRYWFADGDEFQYPLNPNLRYSHATVNTMRAEWEFRITRASVLVELCREVNIKFPHRLAMRLPTDTPQLLQRALHCIRDEVNRMTQRLQRSSLMKTANKRAEDGLMDDAHQYFAWSMDVMYESDIEMSDDDDNE
ncbi:hypothetical protein HYC85_029152 [Camellia sinensis]|uniref:Uncharacterized protein n=1 Tax=Camellia sinensis TaxID=4442 RepID=A0A7J7FYE0_CAMSI|nr:hypothetical protein HYC85_029152 [Camellia sinensis]